MQAPGLSISGNARARRSRGPDEFVGTIASPLRDARADAFRSMDFSSDLPSLPVTVRIDGAAQAPFRTRSTSARTRAFLIFFLFLILTLILLCLWEALP